MTTTISLAQNKQTRSDNLLKMRWSSVATRMSPEWYSSEEAKKIAETVLLFQKEIGGWEKNQQYHLIVDDSKRSELVKRLTSESATIDNGSTITEMRFLARMHENTGDNIYHKAFEKGVNFLLEAQYDNGGWPQYYPIRNNYSRHITYNDNAMINVMRLLKEIYTNSDDFNSIELGKTTNDRVKKAFDKGVECIINTQIKIDGNLAVWCAQHDKDTLEPTEARAYELASLSGAESVGVTLLLMDIDNPSKEVIEAVKGAVNWFENNKVEGIKIERRTNEEGVRDRMVVEDENAPPLWGRFNDLETGKPFFCDRDGIKRDSLSEIGFERRNGYSWYTNSPSVVLKQYPNWKKKWAPQLAFPTAEGYGKYTVGGRGGKVYEVTNLNDAGRGSLREAVEASGPRTVVFRVSGTINLEKPLTIQNPYITIAGQTAPGDGICISRYPLNIGADEIIIRYIRVRLGDDSGREDDAIGGRYHKNIIIDHVSTSWSIDECMSIYMCEYVTIQWCMITESLYNSNHAKGTHGYGGIWGSNYSTYHHNLIAHHSSRNPRFASGSGYNDYRNNVIYNWGYNSAYGGEYDYARMPGNSGDSFYINMVANYYKPGPATKPGNVSHRIAEPSYRENIDNYGKWYVADNYVVGNPVVTANNWNGGVQVNGGSDHIAALKLNEPWDAMPIREQSAEEAYISVLEKAGAIYPKRDAVDTRIIDEVRGGFATYEGSTYKTIHNILDSSKNSGIIDSPNDVGGWPELKSKSAPVDSDHDGMPDSWEIKNGLDPNNSEDSNKIAPDGYTYLEKYINSLCNE